MNKIRLKFILITVFALSVFSSIGQNAIPQDKDVIVGKLSNGLTYYIRHNETPKNRVNFHIVQKVGSILEEPKQRGLAHFLEHMAFNGTKNFPGDKSHNGILSWCESNGIKFGRDLNAGTGIDETIYDIMNVPSKKKNIVDSCLLILHDWSSALLLSSNEIDKERGVIHEELRTTNTANQRCIQSIAEQVYGKGSKYSDCLPGGSVDVVDNFEYETLRSYYKKWYRPDLQAIVVVGDIDPIRIEKKIKTIFSDIKTPKNPAKRIYYSVESNDSPIIAIATDSELTSPMGIWSYKIPVVDKETKKTPDYIVYNYLSDIVSLMMNDRLAAIANEPGSIIHGGNFSKGGFLLSGYAIDNFEIGFSFDEKKTSEAIKVIYTEVERARRFGFTVTEYERARTNYLKQKESMFASRKTIVNNVFAQKCIKNFTHGEPLLSIKSDYNSSTSIANNISVDIVNNYFKGTLTNKNQVFAFMLPKKSNIDIPSKRDIREIISQVQSKKIEAYKEEKISKPLIEKEPTSGKIIKESVSKDLKTTKWILSNGVELFIKKTKFEEDFIEFKAFSKGGLLAISESDSLYATELSNVTSIVNLGTFSNTELMRYLSGKMVDIQPSVDLDSDNISGKCSKKDISTLCKLLYLLYTDIKIDSKQFDAWKTKRKAQIEMMSKEPNKMFGDAILKTVYKKYPSKIITNPSQIDKLTVNRFVNIIRKRFSNAADFKFVLVGDIDINKLKPLVEKYIASLKTSKKIEKVNLSMFKPNKGNRVHAFNVKQTENKASIFSQIVSKYKYNLKNIISVNIFSQIMNYRLYRKMREDEGGVYSPYIAVKLTNSPMKRMIFTMVYDTDPKLVTKMKSIVKEDLYDLSKNGPSKEDFIKAVKYLKKEHAQLLKNNSYWINQIQLDIDNKFNQINEFSSTLDSIDLNDIKHLAKILNRSSNRYEVIMKTKK